MSAIPGTTRDSVDSELVRDGQRYLFVDTAGIRKSRHLQANVDYVSVVQSRRSIDRADVALLILDASEGLREMDATIGGYVHEAGRGIVVVVNKWDLSDTGKTKAMETRVRDSLKFLSYAPIVFTSAKSGKGLGGALKAAREVYAANRLRIATGPLNRIIAKAAERHAPKANKGNHAVRILFATQIGVAPPTFVLSLNHPVDLHFSYRRYLENQLREEFGFEGAPIVLKVRTRRH